MQSEDAHTEEQSLVAEMERQQEEMYAATMKMSAEDFIDLLDDHYMATTIVIEGLNMASQLSEGSAIAAAAIVKLRSALELAMSWIESQHTTNEDSSKGVSDTEGIEAEL